MIQDLGGNRLQLVSRIFGFPKWLPLSSFMFITGHNKLPTRRSSFVYRLPACPI